MTLTTYWVSLYLDLDSESERASWDRMRKIYTENGWNGELWNFDKNISKLTAEFRELSNREIENGSLYYVTTDLREAKKVRNRAIRAYLGANFSTEFASEKIQISTQPECPKCGVVGRFSDDYCCKCGTALTPSRHIDIQ